MTQIHLAVCGDHWLNPQDLRDRFPQDNNETLVLRMSGEGPSLWSTGIVQETLELCAKYGRAPGTVWVGDWSNSIEEVPFARFTMHAASHFFWMSDRYRATDIPPAADKKWFGYFLGRANLHRARMLQDLLADHPQDLLTSVMVDSGIERLDKDRAPDRDGWLADQDAGDFYNWCRACDIPSLDGHTVRDQYDPAQNTNRDILAHYGRFRVEITAETYTIGDCFFPTEKTIRPLSQGRGLLVYGPVDFLRRLRSMGFRTWDTIWDETYDSVQGPLRWQLMRTELGKIAVLDPGAVERELQEIYQHNSAVLEKIIHTFRPG